MVKLLGWFYVFALLSAFGILDLDGFFLPSFWIDVASSKCVEFRDESDAITCHGQTLSLLLPRRADGRAADAGRFASQAASTHKGHLDFSGRVRESNQKPARLVSAIRLQVAGICPIHTYRM
jgi:hypothetical protein